MEILLKLAFLHPEYMDNKNYSIKLLQINEGTVSFYLSRILGNVFNLLTSINAAANFILYCAMSDRFRQTCIQTFCGKRLTPVLQKSR